MNRSLRYSLTKPSNIIELAHLENVFDVFDLYLWLSYRFPDMFPDSDLVRDTQKQLDEIIYDGVCCITKLLQKNEKVQVQRQSPVRSKQALDAHVN